MKKLISMLLTLSLVFGLSASAFAAEGITVDLNSDVKIEVVNDNFAKFYENGNLETVKVNGQQVIYNNLTTGEEIILTVDGNRIHSSATGETIVVSNEEVQELVSAVSSGEHPKSMTKKFSYASIKKALGGTASTAVIAAAIITLLTSAGITVPGALAAIVDLIGGMSGLVGSVMDGSSKHGIKIYLKEKKRRAVRQGKEYFVWVWSIESISKY